MSQVGAGRVDGEEVYLVAGIPRCRCVLALFYAGGGEQLGQRDIDTQHGHCAVATVADGHQIGHQGNILVLARKEGLRPIGLGGLQRLQEPFLLQVVVPRAVQRLYDDGAVASQGVGAEPSSLLRIVALAEAQPAALHIGVQLNDALHDGVQTLGVRKTVLDVRNGIDGGGIDLCQNLLSGLPLGAQHVFAQDVGIAIDYSPRDTIDNGRDDTHGDEQREHNTLGEPLGKSAGVGTLVFLL